MMIGAVVDSFDVDTTKLDEGLARARAMLAGMPDVSARVRDNIGLAKHLARSFQRGAPSVWHDEFESAALWGLFEAARKCPDDDRPFAPFAGMVIKRRLIAAYRSLNGHEKNRPRPAMEPLVDEPWYEESDEGDDFGAMVARLPDREARLVTLVFRDDLTITDAGKALGLGRMATFHAYHRAITKLREAHAA